MTSKMKKLFDPTISRKTKRQPAHIVGYYTTPEAAKKLGVDPATLRYRRDTADAKAYWEMFGVQVTDKMSELLTKSHMLVDRHHYYEKKAFDKFVNIYNKRPTVIAARARRLRFPPKAHPITTLEITTDTQVDDLANALRKLIEAKIKLTVMVGI